MHSILIVKTSSIGDVIQAAGVLSYLKAKFPDASISWVIEKGSEKLLKALPQVDHVIVIDTKKWRKNLFRFSTWKEVFKVIRVLSSTPFDVLFDLQGNLKSGLITYFSNAKQKVGFGVNSVSEKPNLWFTHHHVEVDKRKNIYRGYLDLIQKYLKDSDPFIFAPTHLNLDQEESIHLKHISEALESPRKKILMALGSNWENKKIRSSLALEMLKEINKEMNPIFVFVYASNEEKNFVLSLKDSFSCQSVVLDPMSLPLLQAVIRKTDGVICLDSSVLHLAAMADVATFSVFGPSSPFIYKPQGKKHAFVQGFCPYGQPFVKRCNLLRKCPTGSCIKDLSASEVLVPLRRWLMLIQEREVYQSRCENLQLLSPLEF